MNAATKLVAHLVTHEGVALRDALNLVKTAMEYSSKEKQARFGDMLSRGFGAARRAVGRVFNRPIPLKPAPGSPPGVPPPRMSLGRKALIGGATLGAAGAAGGTALGGGALAYGHLRNDARDTVGRSLNPLTWVDPASEEDVFARNNNTYASQIEDMKAAIMQKHREGDHAGAAELRKQMMQGDFGQSRWSFGRLNPFVPGRAKGYAQTALSAQQALQGKYDAEMKKSAPNPGDAETIKQLEQMLSQPMLQSQADAIQQQLDMLRQRAAAPAGGTENDAARGYAARMRAAGMRMTPRAAPAATATGSATPWRTQPGFRPGQGRVQGYGNTPYTSPWDDVTGNNHLRFSGHQ